MPDRQLLRIAHRGYSARYPENTLPAFEQAIRAGADMIELDVHLSKDGRIVVIHDDTIDRTSNGRGRVADLTFGELLSYNFNNGMAACGFVAIPALAEVIDLAGPRVALDIEIKKDPRGPAGLEKRLVDLLREKEYGDRAIVSSFDRQALGEVNRLAGDLKTGLIYDRILRDFRDAVRALGVRSVHPALGAVDAGELRWAKSSGIMVYPWVVKDRKTLDAFRDLDFIDGVTVNDLALFQKEERHGV